MSDLEEPRPTTVTESETNTPPAKKTAIELARTTGIFKDYLTGLDHLRHEIEACDNSLKSALKEFYGTEVVLEENFNRYLLEVNASFVKCNRSLADEGHSNILVDGQVPIATMVNKLKEFRVKVESSDLNNVVEFWENFKMAVERLQIIADDFEKRVLEKMKVGCLMIGDDGGNGLTPELTKKYKQEARGYLQDLQDCRLKIRLLAASAGTHMKFELVWKSSYTDRLLTGCEDEFYPILMIVPDLTIKLETLFRTAYQWLDKDETYLFEIVGLIRQKKTETKEKEEVLRSKKDKQKALTKSLRSTYLMCQNSKKRLREITTDLEKLENQITDFSQERRVKLEEKKQKKSMSEFLAISISQTKRNYALQMKRQKLVHQVRELEDFLQKIERELIDLKQQLSIKSNERGSVQNLHEHNEHSYTEMKQDLELYSQNVQSMCNELRGVRHYLTLLENVQNVKTSPETVDFFYDRPRSVKLAPSLKTSISNLRRRRLNNVK